MKCVAKCAALRTLLAIAITTAIATGNPARAANYSFDYTTAGTAALGIDRVFDDGKDTVLRFVNPISAADRPTVTTADGTVLQTRVVANYLVLPGVQRHVLIYSKGYAAQIQHGRAPDVYLPPAQQSWPSAPVAPPTAASFEPVAMVPSTAERASEAHRTAPVIVTSSVAGIQTAQPVAVGTPATAALPAKPDPDAARPGGGLSLVSDELPPLPTWEAKAGSTLRTTTEAWAKQAGWTVRWLLNDGDDYEVDAVKYSGDFAESLAKLYAPYFAPSFNNDKPLHVKAYAKPKVIVVSE